MGRKLIMASGKKNYFRHSFHARKNADIAGLIEDHGKEAYFHFFGLVEVCAEKASDKFPDDSRFIFRRSTLCRELLVTNSRLARHLVAMTPSLVDQVVVTEKEVEILFPKLAKYMGKYESKLLSNSPNKRKEIKEKKENKETDSLEGSENSDSANLEIQKPDDFAIKVLDAMNKICDSSHRPNKANTMHINARIKENYKIEDFILVIDHKFKQWSNDPKMREYIRPRTLFSTNFDGYLQSAKNALKPKSDPLVDFFKSYGIEPDNINKNGVA